MAETSTDMANPTRCRICGDDFFYHTKLVAHCKDEHPEKRPYRCAVCDVKMTNNFDHLKRHMKGPCSTPNAAQEVARLRLAAASSPNPIDAVTNTQSVFWRTTCRICSYLAANERDLLNHLFHQHRNLWLFKCGRCGYYMSTGKRAMEHFQSNCNGEDTEAQEDGGLEGGHTDDGAAARTEQVGSASTTQEQTGPRPPAQPTQPTTDCAVTSQQPLRPSSPLSEEFSKIYRAGCLFLPRFAKQLVPLMKEDLDGMIKSAVDNAFTLQRREHEPSATMQSTDHEAATVEHQDISQSGSKEALEAEARQLRIQLNESATRLVEIEQQLHGVEEDQEMEDDQDMDEQYGGEYQEEESDGDE